MRRRITSLDLDAEDLDCLFRALRIGVEDGSIFDAAKDFTEQATRINYLRHRIGNAKKRLAKREN